MNRNIVAISTAMGNGGISIIRLSGKDVRLIADKVFLSIGGICPSNFEPRKMYLGEFSYNDTKDRCMCVYFKAPYSYTGEDMIEFQCHGGITLTNKIFESLVELGCEPATKGEFSKLAFLNGKLSLDEAEGIIDVINAESDSELKSGYNLMQGGLRQEVENIQVRLTELLAKLEVTLDYPEEDLEEETRDNVRLTLENIKSELVKILSTASYGKCIKDGVRILIYGRTNAGKSSLLNTLLNYDRAIVTDVQGTTRDTLEEVFNYKGYKFILIDSAGIRQSDDIVESIGINKSKKALDYADIVLYIVDDSQSLEKEDKDIIKSISDKNVIVVVNKSDLNQKLDADCLPFKKILSVSTKTGANIETLKEMLLDFVVSQNTGVSNIVLTNTRHIDAIRRAIDCVDMSLNSVKDDMVNLDLVSIDIKNVWLALGDITGNSDNEKIIDDIFSKFCVGK
jgi:tRNA modification GTPase